MSDSAHKADEVIKEEQAPPTKDSSSRLDSKTSATKEEAEHTLSKKQQSDTHTATAENLIDSLARAEARAAEHYEAMLRAVAEVENARRRTQEEIAKAHKYAIEKFAEHLLPVMDSMYAALADDSTDAAKVREGVELTMKQLSAAFEKGRIIELNPLGEKFDPHCHQAISMVPADQEPNTVVAVLQRGYQLADRVLRPALVTVAQSK